MGSSSSLLSSPWRTFCALVLAFLAGCAEDLPRCDDAAARELVFSRDGQPAHPGQALMEVSCSGDGSFCHAPGAEGAARRGAPAGLDFHVSPACSGEACDMAEVTRLDRNQRNVVDWAHEIAGLVDRGAMPPDGEGRTIQGELEDALAYTFIDGDEPRPLPSLGTDEGEAILRNWLACGAPVVERAGPPGDPDVGSDPQPGDLCTEETDVVGDCFVFQPVSPNWTDINERIIQGTCVSCHGPGPLDDREVSQLDLSTEGGNDPYEALVGSGGGAPAAGDPCAGDGALVVPGAPEESLLVAKLEAARDDSVMVCGDPMPIGDSVDGGSIAAIREWIANGAPEN
ncbi:MAG: hypothetical protein ACOCXM_04870 [Myxococcota bacterium]